MEETIKFLLVDDHPILRQGVTSLIECQYNYQVEAQAASISEAITLLNSQSFEFAIIDLSLTDGNGLDLVKYIRNNHSHILILVLSVMEEEFYAERAIKTGANGYIMKKAASKEVLRAIQQILDGRIYFSESLSELLLARAVDHPWGSTLVSIDKLNEQELEVFQLIGKGLEPRQIAHQLELPCRTVEICKRRLKNKLMLKRSAELRQYAIAWTSQAVGVGT